MGRCSDIACILDLNQKTAKVKGEACSSTERNDITVAKCQQLCVCCRQWSLKRSVLASCADCASVSFRCVLGFWTCVCNHRVAGAGIAFVWSSCTQLACCCDVLRLLLRLSAAISVVSGRALQENWSRTHETVEKGDEWDFKMREDSMNVGKLFQEQRSCERRLDQHQKLLYKGISRNIVNNF